MRKRNIASLYRMHPSALCRQGNSLLNRLNGHYLHRKRLSAMDVSSATVHGGALAGYYSDSSLLQVLCVVAYSFISTGARQLSSCVWIKGHGYFLLFIGLEPVFTNTADIVQHVDVQQDVRLAGEPGVIDTQDDSIVDQPFFHGAVITGRDLPDRAVL